MSDAEKLCQLNARIQILSGLVSDLCELLLWVPEVHQRLRKEIQGKAIELSQTCAGAIPQGESEP